MSGTESSGSRASASRARLEAAAIQAIAARGFHGTTTRDIASAAGMSPAALYVHHRSKEDLLHLIALAGHQVILEGVRTARSSSPDPITQLHAAITQFVRYHAHDHTRARVVTYELAALEPEHLEQILALRHEISAEMRGLVTDGVEAGVFDCEDPHLTATALLSLGVDVARWYREGGTLTPEELGEKYAALALRLVGA